jgi:hypothetical protein
MTSGGDYTFGELTAKFYNLTPDEHQHWKSDVRKYPKDVQDEIKRHIIYALTRVDDQGNEAPIPLSIKWKRSGPKSVTCTYDRPDPSGPNPPGPSFTILITGFPMPLASSFAERRGKY